MSLTRSESGFTLIELVMVIVILGVVGGLIARSFQGSVDMVRQQVAMFDETSEARRLVSTASEELRYAASAGAFTTWTSKDCGFGTIRGDSVRFTWSGAAGAPLTARYNTTIDTLSRSVDSLCFSYLDSSGSAAASSATIQNVALYLRLNRSGAVMPIGTLVHVRN